MSHLSNSLERSIGEAYLNGVVNNTTNKIAYALGLTQAAAGNKLYVSLHTGDPTVDAPQNEVTTTAYPGYQRAEVRREGSFSPPSTSKWTASGTAPVSFTNAEAIMFPIAGSGASATLTHWGIWSSSSSTNADDLLLHGPLVTSGADWKLGYHAGVDAAGAASTTFVFCQSHGLAAADTIRCYEVYDGLANNMTLAGANTGVQKVVNTAPTVNTFTVTVSFAGGDTGAFLFIKSSSLALTAGKIPSIPAGGMKIRFA